MDFLESPTFVLSMASLILLLLLSVHQELVSTVVANANSYGDVDLDDQYVEAALMDMDVGAHVTLQPWRLWNTLTSLNSDFLHWIEPRPTTWFSRFLLHEYDDEKWVQMFRMTKRAMMSLANVLQPSIQRRDTDYRYAIPVIVRLACTLFKLSHGASLLVCSEKFGVRRSTVSKMLRDVVWAINDALRSKISWPTGDRLLSTAADFYQLCGLPGVVGAIDGTQIPICKPKFGAMDYYNYFKIKGYSMNCQAVVDSSKRFLDICIGMPGSTHDSRVLRRSTLYSKAQRNVLWYPQTSFQGFTPYLLGDSRYPLLPWLMVPHRRQQGELSMPDALFNEKMCQGRKVVEDAFALLKQSFKELQVKSELDVTFLPDVVVCCALLHNVLLQQSHEDVERQFEALRTENGPPAQEADGTAGHEVVGISKEQMCHAVGARKRRDLGLYLSGQLV